MGRTTGGLMEVITLEDLQNEPDRVGVRLEGGDGTALEIANLELDDSVFNGTRLTGVHFPGVRLSSCELVDVEMSGANLSESSLVRTTFRTAKMVSVDFTGAVLTDVTFEDCLLTSAFFRMSRLLRVRFENCELESADFTQSKIRDGIISRSRLSTADFSHASIESLDMRTSELFGVRGVGGLMRATIDEMQASALGPQLAQELGMRVESTANATSERLASVQGDASLNIADDVGGTVDTDFSPEEARAHVAELRNQLTNPRH